MIQAERLNLLDIQRNIITVKNEQAFLKLSSLCTRKTYCTVKKKNLFIHIVCVVYGLVKFNTAPTKLGSGSSHLSRCRSVAINKMVFIVTTPGYTRNKNKNNISGLD